MPTEASVSELRSRIAAISFNANEEFDNRDWEARDFAIADRAIAVTLDTVMAEIDRRIAENEDAPLPDGSYDEGYSCGQWSLLTELRAHIDELVTGGHS